MKKLLSVFFFLFCGICYSQVTAVTEQGDSVYLWDDGTWQFVHADSSEADSASYDETFTIDTNSTQYTKSSNALKALKGQKVKYELWYDADKWSQANINRDDAEYYLKNDENEAFCLVLPERLTTTTYGLLDAAYQKANSAGGVDSVSYEMRKVNNNYVAMMKMYVKINDIHFLFMGYYYTGEERTIQVITFTTINLVDEYIKDMEELLNGFVVP